MTPPWLKRIEDGFDSYLDRDWAAVAELREDGVARVVPLTIDRVEAFAFDFWQTGRSMSFTIPIERTGEGS
jgi:hypothetical protein